MCLFTEIHDLWGSVILGCLPIHFPKVFPLLFWWGLTGLFHCCRWTAFEVGLEHLKNSASIVVLQLCGTDRLKFEIDAEKVFQVVVLAQTDIAEREHDCDSLLGEGVGESEHFRTDIGERLLVNFGDPAFNLDGNVLINDFHGVLLFNDRLYFDQLLVALAQILEHVDFFQTRAASVVRDHETVPHQHFLLSDRNAFITLSEWIGFVHRHEQHFWHLSMYMYVCVPPNNYNYRRKQFRRPDLIKLSKLLFP